MRRFAVFFIIILLVVSGGLALGSSPARAQTPAPTPQVTGAADFAGRVSMSAEQPLPDGLEVVLEAYNSDFVLLWNGRAPVQVDGSFRFEGVPLSEGRVFAAYIVYEGVDFISDQGMLGTESNPIRNGDVVELTFTLAEASTDTSKLEATRLHVILEPVSEGVLQVSLWYVINNPMDRVVGAAEAGKPVLRFAIPAGATNLQFSDMNDTTTLVGTDDGFGDTASVQPGSNYQMFYTMKLAYKNGDEFALPVHMPVRQAIIMVTDPALSVSGTALSDSGDRTMSDGTKMHVYTSSELAAENVLRFTFASSSQFNPIWIGVIGLGLALAALAAWFLIRRKRDLAEAGNGASLAVDAQPAQEMDDLLDSILALDDLHNSGEIEDAVYERRRAELKECVRLLKDEDAGE